jgi:hypothetical protein
MTAPNSRIELIRYEDAAGAGLFQIVGMFEDYIESRAIRLNRTVAREVNTLVAELRDRTPIPPPGSYDDRLSRRPLTWFRATALDVLKIADRLVLLLNQLGADIRCIRTRRVPAIIWQDAVQVITRAPRRATQTPTGVLLERRRRRRRKLRKLRERAGRRRARQAKSGL